MARLSPVCLVPLLLMAIAASTFAEEPAPAAAVAPAAVTEEVKKAELNGFALANNYFGFNLLNQLSEENALKSPPENVFFSPYSVSIALAMLYQGSAGNTSNQLESTLGYQLARIDNDKSVLAQQIRASDAAILVPDNAPNASYVLKAGNALLQSKQFEMLDAYKQSLTENYRAELFSLDFNTEGQAAMNLVNQWVDTKTNGKIKKLLPEPPSKDTLLALVNAVYFKGTWKEPFNPSRTEPGTFHGPNGVNYTDVPFMKSNDRFKWAQISNWNASLLELPYQGDDLSFFAILPEEGVDIKTVKKQLSPSSVETAIAQLSGREIQLALRFPKLDFKTNYDLVDTLKAAGITDVFDASRADLSGISARQQLRVDVVKHMATIEVNEEGAEAAGATFVGITKTSLVRYQPLHFDRPFVFFIRHNQNGQVLFLGEVNQFKKESE